MRLALGAKYVDNVVAFVGRVLELELQLTDAIGLCLERSRDLLTVELAGGDAADGAAEVERGHGDGSPSRVGG